MILAIETSCDDTCAALVTAAGEIRSNVISSQGIHDRYGGVVPEVAARHHLELMNPVLDDALATAGATMDDVDLVAVTQGPGLVGALLVGVATAKGIAAARGLPLAPVDHLQGHVAANFLARVDDPAADSVTLGSTLDDAAGEAFDKGARLLGLGYPGGPEVDRLARKGDPEAFAFPRSPEGFANAWLVGLFAGVASLAAMRSPRARYVAVALSAWLLASAFILPRRSELALWNDLAVSVLLLLVSIIPGTMYVTRLDSRRAHA